jgi:hypothetical protein
MTSKASKRTTRKTRCTMTDKIRQWHDILMHESSSYPANKLIQMLVNDPSLATLAYANDTNLPLHIECKYQCRSSILSKCIELYPEALSIADIRGYLPLHLLLWNRSSSVEDALMLMENYAAALEHQTVNDCLALHIECHVLGRSGIIAKYIELYPQSLGIVDDGGCVPLHRLLENRSSSIDVALMMIEQYPAALQHGNTHGKLPIHFECSHQCRLEVLRRCIELYPESLEIRDRDRNAPLMIIVKRILRRDSLDLLHRRLPAISLLMDQCQVLFASYLIELSEESNAHRIPKGTLTYKQILRILFNLVQGSMSPPAFHMRRRDLN